MSSEAVDPHKIQPLGEFVVVELEHRKSQTHSGLFLSHATTGVEKVREGVGHVVAVGNGSVVTKGPRSGERKPLDVAVGDRVLFKRFLKDSIPLSKKDGTEYCMIHQGDLLGIVAEGVECGIFGERKKDDGTD